MSLGILGNKIGMTQIFDTKGNAIPVTIIKSSPCIITQIKSKNNHGYNSIQLGYCQTTGKSLTKPERGHLNKFNLPLYRYLKEFKVNNVLEHTIGQKVSVEIFKIGQEINITGLTIGKGNASNIKRNHFSRGPMAHGSKHHRLQGSLGAGTSPGRVFPGKKMPGRLGMEKCTIKNLEIMDIDSKNNLIVIKGCIPGKSGNLISLSIKN